MRQPLLAAELYDVECNQLEHRAMMDWEGDTIKIGFQPVPPQLMDINSCQVEAGPFNPPVLRLNNQNLALNWTLILQILILNLK